MDYLYKMVTPAPKVTVKLTADRNPTKDLLEIPLFNFAHKLKLTYQNTKDNLTKECLRHDICRIQMNE